MKNVDGFLDCDGYSQQRRRLAAAQPGVGSQRIPAGRIKVPHHNRIQGRVVTFDAAKVRLEQFNGGTFPPLKCPSHWQSRTKRID